MLYEVITDEIYELDTQYAGLSRTEKIKLVRAEMKNMDATHYVVPMLDEIAWLLNLRGDDVENNPIFHAYVRITSYNVCYTKLLRFGTVINGILKHLHRSRVERRIYTSPFAHSHFHFGYG